MLYSTDFVALDDQISALSKAVLESQLTSDLLIKKNDLYQNKTAQEKLNELALAQEAFERIASYQEYAPDFKEKRRALGQAKRQVDLDDCVAAYRVCETTFQDVLDHLCYDLATCVSKDIKVDAGNPFFEFAEHGCGGQCHGNE